MSTERHRSPLATERHRSPLATTGWTLVALAGVVVLFVAYQLWGTGLVQSRQQDSLRHRFERSLAHQRVADAQRSAAGGSSGPASATSAPAVGDPIGTLVIPRIAVDQVVVEGTGSAQLAVGPGHYAATPLPGQPGNAGIAGHRTTHGRPFYDLNDLVTGDPITVTTLQGTFRYLVVRTEVVAPTDLTVLAPSAVPELTLTTCTPRYSAAQRLVVVARLVSTAAPAAAAHRPSTDVAAQGDPTRQPGNWIRLALWVLAALGLVALVVVARRRMAPRRARLVPLAAVPAAMVLLYFLFGAVNAVLPATY
ncbi:MAG: class E sortase [Acidimicrobiales bacterium]|jgi:sortase A